MVTNRSSRIWKNGGQQRSAASTGTTGASNPVRQGKENDVNNGDAGDTASTPTSPFATTTAAATQNNHDYLSAS